jgi:hypothetical protein
MDEVLRWLLCSWAATMKVPRKFRDRPIGCLSWGNALASSPGIIPEDHGDVKGPSVPNDGVEMGAGVTGAGAVSRVQH